MIDEVMPWYLRKLPFMAAVFLIVGSIAIGFWLFFWWLGGFLLPDNLWIKAGFGFVLILMSGLFMGIGMGAAQDIRGEIIMTQGRRIIGRAWLKKNLKKITQVPARRRTILISADDRDYLAVVDFPCLTFVESRGSLFVFWSEKPWTTPKEGVDVLRSVLGAHHNEGLPGRVCLGTLRRGGSSPPTQQYYWQTAFSGVPCFTAVRRRHTGETFTDVPHTPSWEMFAGYV